MSHKYGNCKEERAAAVTPLEQHYLQAQLDGFCVVDRKLSRSEKFNFTTGRDQKKGEPEEGGEHRYRTP